MTNLKSLGLDDYADRELLYLVREEAEQGRTWAGYVTVPEMAKRCGVKGKWANQCVGSRLGWMCRYGVLQRRPKEKKSDEVAYELSEAGRWMIDTELTEAQRKQIHAADPGRILTMVRELSVVRSGAEDSTKNLTRREWDRGLRRQA